MVGVLAHTTVDSSPIPSAKILPTEQPSPAPVKIRVHPSCIRQPEGVHCGAGALVSVAGSAGFSACNAPVIFCASLAVSVCVVVV